MNYLLFLPACGSMAGVVDRLRRKPRPAMGATTPQQGNDWTTSGSFINKPSRGWLHPDEQLMPDAGICYGVRVRITSYEDGIVTIFNVVELFVVSIKTKIFCIE